MCFGFMSRIDRFLNVLGVSNLIGKPILNLKRKYRSLDLWVLNRTLKEKRGTHKSDISLLTTPLSSGLYRALLKAIFKFSWAVPCSVFIHPAILRFKLTSFHTGSIYFYILIFWHKYHSFTDAMKLKYLVIYGTQCIRFERYQRIVPALHNNIS